MNIPDSTPKNDVILTLVTMVTYQWVVTVDDRLSKDVVARDGPFHMSPIILPIGNGLYFIWIQILWSRDYSNGG